MVEVISDNGVSRVWREGDWVYKQQPKHLTDNEIWCINQMAPSGYAPDGVQTSVDTIKMEDLGRSEEVGDRHAFMGHLPLALAALAKAGIRHGDLTEYSVIVKGDWPWLVDFGESRVACDPRPDKRREGDRYWLARTMAKLCRPHNERAPEQWGMIYSALDFQGKTVLDVGCGRGDLLGFALAAGASLVVGVDDDRGELEGSWARGHIRANLHEADLVEWLRRRKKGRRHDFDVAFCLSVLPYVDMEATLLLLAQTAIRVVVECQYRGDGPGTVSGDAEMQTILERLWRNARALGITKVQDRDARRTLWLCDNLRTEGVIR